ncbi:MAG: histidine kinase dimerization/phospho-acceptor domain-containing protein, partial [Spirochaetota bacterium]
MARRRQRIATGILVILLTALPGIGGLQWHLLNQARDAEQVRLTRGLAGAGFRIRSTIVFELTSLATRLTSWASAEGHVSRVPDLLSEWVEETRYEGLVERIVVTTRGEAGDEFSTLVPVDATLEPVAPSDIEWLARIVDASRESARSLVIDDPLVLAVRAHSQRTAEAPGRPAESTGGGSGAGEVVPINRTHTVLMRLDVDYLASVVLPELAAESLGSDRSGFELAALDARTGELLYATEAVAFDDFAFHPDGVDGALDGREPTYVPELVIPLVRSGPDVTALARLLFVPSEGILFEFSNPQTPGAPGAQPGRSLVEASDVIGAELGPRLPEDGLALVLFHDAGSVRAAANAERNQAFALSALVLLSFAAVAALFYALYLRSQRLRDREQEFIASVTHELRTPLAAMHGVAENLAAGIVTRPERVREYGRALIEHSMRLQGLVDQTLLHAGMNAGADRARRP